MTSNPLNSCWTMGGAQARPQAGASWTRFGATARLRVRPGETRVMGSPNPVTFSLTRSWIWKWLKYSINLLISVFKVQEIGRFQASMPWLMALQGIQRPYEDQPAGLQGWGHKRCHHIPKLALGLNSVSLCWVPGLHLSPLCYSFSARLPRGAGEKFRDIHHPGWCTHCCNVIKQPVTTGPASTKLA